MPSASGGGAGTLVLKTKAEKAWWSSFLGQRLYKPIYAWWPTRCPETGDIFFLHRVVRVSAAYFDDRHSIDRKLGPYRLEQVIPMIEWTGYHIDMIQVGE